MSDIFQEVDEELRRDKAQQIWRRHGRWILGAAILLVLGVAGYQFWKIYTLHRQEAAGAAYVAAYEAALADPAKAGDFLGPIATADSGYGQLAKLDLAGLALKAGDKEKAVALFAAASEDPGLLPPLRDLARILAAYVELDLGKNEAAAARIADLAAPGQAYRPAALEISALAAFAAGDKEKARTLYEELAKLAAEPGAPANLAERAKIMRDRLGQ